MKNLGVIFFLWSWVSLQCLSMVQGQITYEFAPGCTFCDRYAGGATSTAQQQVDLVENYVLRMFEGGNGNQSTGAPVVVTGIMNQPNLLLYFNGTRPAGSTNYAANPSLLLTLQHKFITFFTEKLICTKGQGGSVYNPDLAAVHANMMIYQLLMETFNEQVYNSILSFRTWLDSMPYITAILDTMNKGAGIKQICSQSDCSEYTPLVEIIACIQFVNGVSISAAYWCDRNSQKLTTIYALPGSNIQWIYNTFRNVVETLADHSTVKIGGFTSGPVNAPGEAGYSYLLNFPTEGTYYFKCANPSHPNMIGTIVITPNLPTASSAGMKLFVFRIMLLIFVFWDLVYYIHDCRKLYFKPKKL